MLKQFFKEMETKKRSKKTIETLKYVFEHTQKFLNKPLENAEYNDILNYLIMLKNDEKLSPSTIALHQTKLRQFYAFCSDESDNPKFLKMSKKLKTSIPKTNFKPHDILTSEDVKKLINVATLERDRCIVAVLFESGMRLGEMLALSKAMVIMNEKEQSVTFNIPEEEGCKTGGRTVVCLEVYGYVQDWLKCNTSDMFMPMSRRAIADITLRLFKRANINKPANPHAFRHAAITHCVSIGMQQNAIGQRFWGNVSTNMLKVYISLSEQMQADAYKNAKGMSDEKNKVINPLASRCVVCGKLIQSGELCEVCKTSKKLTIKNTMLSNELNVVSAKNTMLSNEFEDLKGDIRNQELHNQELMKEMVSIKKFMEKLISAIPEGQIEEVLKKVK